MQDIMDMASGLTRWRDDAAGLSSLEQLSVAAHAAVSCDTPSERAASKGILLQRAEVVGCRRELAGVFRALETERAQDALRRSAPEEDLCPYLTRDGQGRIASTIENYLHILETDPQFAPLRYDEMADAPVVVETKLGRVVSSRRWVDADDAAALQHIESTYGLYDRRKYRDAFLSRLRSVRWHPLKETIEAIEWDGEPRIERFLYNWMGCEDTPVTREASRLLFAGGIHRLYEPGCKFDYLVVLIGTQQGEGKSTLVRWLALEDNWYGEVTLFDGKEAVEQLSGAWICEVSEMLAFTRARDQALVKSFLSRQSDKIRRPYAERPEEIPRRCIMIGTTNNRNFLRDKTGNRRYLPVEVHMNAPQLYYLEDACRADIRQCWAEALALYKAGKLAPMPDNRLRKELRMAQDDAMEDDWRVGAIEAYLAEKPEGAYVCVRELKREALYKDADAPFEPNRRESVELGLILDGMEGWERAGRINFQQYGQQRSWKKTVTK